MNVSLLIALVTATFSKILADEAKEWMAWLPRKLISWAARRFPVDFQDRIEEEWFSHANDLPGNCAKLWHAAGCAAASVRATHPLGETILLTVLWPILELDLVLLIAIGATVKSLFGISIFAILHPDPEKTRLKRLRKAAGGLHVLGINELALRPEDDEFTGSWREVSIKACRKFNATSFGQALTPTLEKKIKRYRKIIVWIDS